MDIKTEDSVIGKTFHEIVVDSIDIAILVTDSSGKLLYLNSAAETMWLLPRHESLGSSFLLALAEWERERMKKTFDYVVRTGRSVRASDIVFVNREGQTLYINAYASPFSYSREDEVGIVMWTENITEERKLRLEVHRADKIAALGQLTLGLAHELRTPLGTIKALAGLIELNLEEEPPDVRKYISVLNNEVNRLDKLSRELLDFGGRRSLNREWVNVNSLLERILYLSSLNRSIRGVKIVKELALDLPEIFGDPENLLHALMNLVLNAFDSLEEEGSIYVKTTNKEDEIVIEIRDTGSGIPGESLTRIFDPFYTTKENGTGLGLSVAHTLISDHQGRIEVESRLKEGTAFMVHLPTKSGGGRP